MQSHAHRLHRPLLKSNCTKLKLMALSRNHGVKSRRVNALRALVTAESSYLMVTHEVLYERLYIMHVCSALRAALYCTMPRLAQREEDTQKTHEQLQRNRGRHRVLRS